MNLDAGSVNESEKPLFTLRSANMALTTDQSFTKNNAFTSYVITKIVAVRKSGASSGSPAGGIYSAASKGGSALVAAAQSYTNLSGAGKIVDCTLAAVNGTDAQTATPILSLTTGNGAALTADFFIYGVVVD